MFIFLIFIIYNLLYQLKLNKISKCNNNIIHFIKCGNSDSILIESNLHFGLIDSSNPINFNISKKCYFYKLYRNYQNNVFQVLNYLKNLNVKTLDFILATHAHIDHLGGIPIISETYVDNSTLFFYKKYNKNINENFKEHYFLAINSMKKKNAKLIDVSNREIKFIFEDIEIELFNTHMNLTNPYYDENQNSILTLIKFRNTKLLLMSDMTEINITMLKNNIGNINIIKLPHHGKGDISYHIFKYINPKYIIISSDYISFQAMKLIQFLKKQLYAKIYITKSINAQAIKLHFLINSSLDFYFEKDINDFYNYYFIIILLIIFYILKYYYIT